MTRRCSTGWTIARSAVLLAAAALVVSMLPDIKRYIRISNM